MENNFCLRNLMVIGVHPHRPMNIALVIFNNLLTVSFIVMASLKCYFDKDLELVETMSALGVVIAKYFPFSLGRKTVKKLLKSEEQFWDINVDDDQISFLVQHFKAVEKMYKLVLVFTITIYSIRPFVSDASSVFNCTVPPHVPFALFYITEVYLITSATFVFVSFNTFVCFNVTLVTLQFRLVNLRIVKLNAEEVESDQDVEVYGKNLKSIIKHQQFLIRCVEDLNDLMSAPIALLMASFITLMCISMYNITMNQGTATDKCRIFVIIFVTIAEFFIVYGLPAQLLMDESAETANTIYSECEWYSPKLRHLRTDYLTIMMRSQESVNIRAANYHVINNRTVLLIVKTAYSFFTFLQKVANE